MKTLACLNALLVLSLAGCLESRSGQVGTVDGQDTRVADGAPVDTVVVADTAVAADTIAVDVGPLCAAPEAAVVAGPAVVPTAADSVVVVDGDTIYGSGLQVEPSGGLFWLRPSEGQVILTGGTGEVPIDGREGAVLIQGSTPGAAAQTLVYRAGDEQVTLTPAEPLGLYWGGSTDAVPHQVVRDRAAWRSCDLDGEGRCKNAALRAWDGGDTFTLWSRSRDETQYAATLPWVDGAGYLWAEPGEADDDPWRLRHWSGTEPVTLRTIDGAVRSVVRHGAGAIWVTEDGVWYGAGAAEAQQLAGGVCGSLGGDGTHTVFGCDSLAPTRSDPAADPIWTPFPHALGPILVVGPDRQARHLAVGGALHVAPRLAGGLVAWIEFDDVSAGCYDQAEGRVMVAPAANPEAPLEVAPVGVGCYCCDAYWADLRLSLDAGLVAWSYARPIEGDPAFGGGPLGWAKVAVKCP